MSLAERKPAGFGANSPATSSVSSVLKPGLIRTMRARHRFLISIGPPHLLTSTVLTFDRHPRAELGPGCGFGMKSAFCGINSWYRRAITLAIVTRRRKPCLTGGYYRRECLGYNRREIGERPGCGATFNIGSLDEINSDSSAHDNGNIIHDSIGSHLAAVDRACARSSYLLHIYELLTCG